ncbi:MAG: acetyl-CoA carboxylase carboxyl transferase subunit alpha [Saccharofermentanales bacterium]
MKFSAYEQVKIARSKDRPTTLAYIRYLFDDFYEFAGDRRYAEDRAVVGGIAFFQGIPCTVIGLEKGSDTKEKVMRNFGSAHPEGYRKALRLMKQAEKFGRPVICFIDTAGAFCGIPAEERGQGQAIAENLMEMMTLSTPVLSILIGEGGSGGALALAVADEVWMMENSVYSVISPEGCASILWKDSSKVGQAAESLKLTADDLLGLDVIEKIVPFGKTIGESAEETDEIRSMDTGYDSCPVGYDISRELFIPLENEIAGFLDRQMKLDGTEIVKRRYARFRKF